MKELKGTLTLCGTQVVKVVMKTLQNASVYDSTEDVVGADSDYKRGNAIDIRFTRLFTTAN